MEDVGTTFNKSPLSQWMEHKFTMLDLADLLRGMNGDHTSNEKRTAMLMKEWKTEQSFIHLGSKQLAQQTPADLIMFLAGWNQKKIEAVDGIDAWNALTPMEQTLRDVALVKELQITLGNEVYNQLPGDEKRIIDLFIWAGCCMHKDQNSFQGGNTEMMEQWEKSGYTLPLLLANKQNAAILRGILDPAKANAPLGEAEATALTASTRGGAKTCAIAGACLNNKDDKKGQGDSHVYHFVLITGSASKRFPDTNNTHFGSFGLAAEWLLIYLQPTRDFLLLIKDKKKKAGWTNIKLNLYNVLHDIPTLTELVVMVLYSQAVSHPYMRVVRGPGTEETNVLDLGEFHRDVQEFVAAIIEDPERLISPDATHLTGLLMVKNGRTPVQSRQSKRCNQIYHI
jgi:hypothetical protein